MNNKSRVFEFLYKNGGNEYNINQIARAVGISVGSAFKVLKGFEKLGYVLVSRKNNALLHRVNMAEKAKELYQKIEEEENAKGRKKTKIICSLSPDSADPASIRKLIEKGMDAASIDASGFNYKTALKLIQAIRQASPDIPILLNIGSPANRHWSRFALKNGLDFVAVSAADAGEIQQVNRSLGYGNIKQVLGEKIKVIAVIGKESLKNYKEIAAESYGVIIDRNNLAASRIEAQPKLQKAIIGECSKYGKPAIISGNILGSMHENRQPMQSEVYDISNAVLEGASCFMLSQGAKPKKLFAETVEILSRIIKGAETGDIRESSLPYDLTNFIGKAVSDLEKILHIDALLILTSGGYSARMISSRRLRCRTIAAASRERILRQLNLLWGIEPLHANIGTEDISNKDKKQAILKALKNGLIGKRDQIAIIASVFHGKSKRTNLLEIHNVSEFLESLSRAEGGQ